MERSNEYQLSREIVARSEASTWDKAKLEWGLEQVYYQDDPRYARAATSQSTKYVCCATALTGMRQSSEMCA